MIHADIPLPAGVVEPAGVAERQLVHSVVDRLYRARVGDQNAGDDMLAVETGTDDETHLVGAGTLGDQVAGVKQAERPDDLELLEDLLDAGGVPVFRPPLVPERVAVGMDARDATFVDAADDRSRETARAVLMNLVHASVYWTAR